MIDSAGFIANLIDFYLLLVVVRCFCRKRSSARIPALFAVIITAFFVTTVNVVFLENKIIALPISIIGMFFILSLVYETKKEIFISIIIWGLITLCVEILIILVLSVLTKTKILGLYDGESLNTVFATFVSKGISYSAIFILFRKKNEAGIARTFSFYQYIFFLLAMLVLCNSTILFERIVRNKEIPEYFVLYFFSSIILLFIAVLYLFDRLIAIVKESEETKRIYELNRAQQTFVEEIHTMIDHLTELNHDYATRRCKTKLRTEEKTACG